MPDTSPRYLAVLDFEATCEDRRAENPDWDLAQQEIIELPVALVDTEERRIVARFGRLIRPERQPLLTPFCTQLTSIQQHEVDGQPTIADVMEEFAAWCEDTGVRADNTLAVTCGDWDLMSMWPKQAAHVPGLETPALFKTWCNLKVIFKAATGARKGFGMMGMLRRLKLPHQGHHHRGEDDVTNIANIVLHLLGRGAVFRATWTAQDRAREHKRLSKKLRRVMHQLEERCAALESIPAGVPPDVGRHVQVQIDTLEAERVRLERYAEVFS